MGVIHRRAFLRYGTGAAALAAPWGARSLAQSTGPAPRVVIVGGGFAGSSCALALRSLDPGIEVTLVDAASRYVTCPMSDAVLVGLRSLESITTTRPGLARSGVRVVHDSVTGIEVAKRRVRLRGGGQLPYDRLVAAPGIRFLFGKPDGYDEAASLLLPHAWQAGAQTELLAAQLRATADGATVAISVPPGLMRCPPAPYERASLIAEWLKRHRPRSKVLIFDANNHFPAQEVFTRAWEERYPGLIEWLPPSEGGAITRVDATTRTLYSSGGAHRVSVANVIPPQAPGQIALDAGLASGYGWCPVDPASFASETVRNVYVVGDACIAGAMPKAASAAHSQALQCASAVAAALRERAIPSTRLESVCYSFLARDAAFLMRAHYTRANGEIQPAEGATDEGRDRQPTAAHVATADSWYRQLRAACFGDL